MRLIDADKLIEFMNKVSFVDTDEIFVDNGKCLVDVEELEKFIQSNAMEDAKPVVHAHWINIKDRLPEIEEPVLVCTNENSCYIVQREPALWGGDKYDWFYGRDGIKTIYLDIRDIIYWMPLPEAPEGVEE